MASSGKYDQRIGVQTFTESRNEYREKVKAWGEPVLRWARVDYGSGAESRISAAQEQSTQIATVYMRDTPNTRQIKPQAARFEFDGYIWDIESAMQSQRRKKEIIFTVKAKT